MSGCWEGGRQGWVGGRAGKRGGGQEGTRPSACTSPHRRRLTGLPPFLPAPRTRAGSGAFRPLVGYVRSLPAPLSHPAVAAAVRPLDRAAIALDARPLLRAGVLLYLLLLHLIVLL